MLLTFRIGILVQATDEYRKVGWVIVQVRMQTLGSSSSSGSCRLDRFWRLDVFNLTGDKVFKVQINEAGQVIILSLLVMLIVIGIALMMILAITISGGVMILLVMLGMLILLMLDMLLMLGMMILMVAVMMILLMMGMMILPLPMLVLFSGCF